MNVRVLNTSSEFTNFASGVLC
uniref:Uncharacterized protein n=1 Tax=Anguilla anguilla TaxID=7936 RepID=A0A0E9TIS1_ANGAN